MSEQRPPVVLLVDDEPSIISSMTRLLRRQGFEVRGAPGGEEALAIVRMEHIDVAVVDLSMPKMSGVEVIRAIKEIKPLTECVMLTAHGDAKVAFEALSAGATDYFTKPVDDMQRFTHLLRKSIEVRELKDKNTRLLAALARETDDLIGRSPGWRNLIAEIREYAPFDMPVLITGESGTGKDRVARAVHGASRVAGGPFLPLNCSAVTEGLLESKLFGYERGAFTDAKARKLGMFEEATNGTIFLDEIGDMPPEMQAKLLRVLQEREITRVGGSRPIKVNARVLAATHRDIDSMVGVGSFREDLYYRLRVLPIAIPPLRERKEDIPMLAYHFARKFAEKYGKTVKSIDRDALNALVEHDWRNNNVRELEHELTRAMVRMRGDVLTLDLLELPAAGQRASTAAPAKSAPEGYDPEWFEEDHKQAKARFVDWFEVSYLTMRLRATGWNITRAAETSGMQRPNFRKLMRRYGVEKPEDLDQDLDG